MAPTSDRPTSTTRPRSLLRYKCSFCNQLSNTGCATRHYTKHKRQLNGRHVDTVHAPMKRRAEMYTQKQVVSHESLVSFASSCADMPEFEGAHLTALLRFGIRLLESHGTVVDTDNLPSSFKLPSPDVLPDQQPTFVHQHASSVDVPIVESASVSGQHSELNPAVQPSSQLSSCPPPTVIPSSDPFGVDFADELIEAAALFSDSDSTPDVPDRECPTQDNIDFYSMFPLVPTSETTRNALPLMPSSDIPSPEMCQHAESLGFVNYA